MKAGNKAALEQMYLEYSNKLYNYGAKFALDKELIKDSIQELFVLLWERRSYFQFRGPHERRAYDPEEG